MKVEAMLLTKSYNENDLYDWLNWHLNVICFDKIHVFDNESNYDVKTVCMKFDDRVEYEYVKGLADKYKLFSKYANICTSDWLMPLDDNEYLYIDDSLNNNVHLLIKNTDVKKICLGCKNLFPSKFKDKRTESLIENATAFCDDMKELNEDFTLTKNTAVKTLFNVKAFEHIEYKKPNSHIPITDDDCTGYTLFNEKSQNSNAMDRSTSVTEPAFILNFQFKSDNEWQYTCANHKSAADVYKNIYNYQKDFSYFEDARSLLRQKQLMEKTVPRTVVTLTSWSKRINVVHETICGFLHNQTIKPDALYLWLSRDEFPEHKISEELDFVCSTFKNVIIKWITPNECGYKRWHVYPMHLQDMVISIDDDMMFYDDLVKECKSYMKDDSVILFTNEGFKTREEADTYLENNTKHEVRFFACSCFPPNTMPDKIFDDENVNKLNALFNTLTLREKTVMDEQWLRCFFVNYHTKFKNIYNFIGQGILSYTYNDAVSTNQADFTQLRKTVSEKCISILGFNLKYERNYIYSPDYDRSEIGKVMKASEMYDEFKNTKNHKYEFPLYTADFIKNHNFLYIRYLYEMDEKIEKSYMHLNNIKMKTAETIALEKMKERVFEDNFFNLQGAIKHYDTYNDDLLEHYYIVY